MQLLTVSTSKKKSIPFGKKTIETGIFKTPISGVVQVFKDHIDGDEQADLKNHGGLSKAVYAYSAEHYAYWQQTLGLTHLPHGSFGENLTFDQLDEAQINIGDKYQLGETVLVVSQPRVPCFKLGLKFENPKLPKLFSKSLKTGVYFSVEQTGKIQAGDNLSQIYSAPNSVSIQTLFEAFFHLPIEHVQSLLKDAMHIEGLSEEWRQQIEQYLIRNGFNS